MNFFLKIEQQKKNELSINWRTYTITVHVARLAKLTEDTASRALETYSERINAFTKIDFPFSRKLNNDDDDD